MDLSIRIEKPHRDEYPTYAIVYIDQMSDDGLILQNMHDNIKETRDLLGLLDDEKLMYRYEADKWTIKEILQHIIDGERVFAYRALCYARDDKAELPSFEQDDYAHAVKPNGRSITDLLNEFEIVRKASLFLFAGFDQATFLKRGNVGGIKVSVRSYAYQIVGHTRHHLEIIKKHYL